MKTRDYRLETAGINFPFGAVPENAGPSDRVAIAFFLDFADTVDGVLAPSTLSKHSRMAFFLVPREDFVEPRYEHHKVWSATCALYPNVLPEDRSRIEAMAARSDPLTSLRVPVVEPISLDWATEDLARSARVRS